MIIDWVKLYSFLFFVFNMFFVLMCFFVPIQVFAYKFVLIGRNVRRDGRTELGRAKRSVIEMHHA